MTKRIIDSMSVDQILTGLDHYKYQSQEGIVDYLKSICKPEPTWSDDASKDTPILCWVAHSLEDLEKRWEIGFIHTYQEVEKVYGFQPGIIGSGTVWVYKCNAGNFYSHARPIAPDEIWQPTKQGDTK